MRLKHLSLFSGIGGFDLAAEWAGWENVAHCEWNEFGQRVLKYYWPDADSHSDITKTDFTKYEGAVDIISGGFPCQPYSQAGKRKGKEDERHLWPEMLRAIREVKPTWVVGENVRGLVNWSDGLVFDEVCADLEAEKYEVQPFLLPASGVGAPHQRERIWFVAYSDNNEPNATQDRQGVGKGNDRNKTRKNNAKQFTGCSFSNQNAPNANDKRLQGRKKQASVEAIRAQRNQQPTRFLRPNWKEFPAQPPICGGDDGLPTELDRITFPKWRNESIKAYGNAIVPQVAYQIFKAINEYKTQSDE